MDWNSVGHQFWNEYSIKNVVCDCATGKIQVASKEVKKQRRALCNECEFKNKFGFCRKCGCKTDWKTSFVKCKCPVGKW
uniref:NADH-PPase NADH pyrophosphatase zinc ribbon domain n=1 Tax=Siphoviridae sp. ctYh54 TaxID=2826379 RepID=A0A8S5ME96_9CAUD|nr:MAG TPA: NADH-PPase NADH pyrophosphatase zinc ribbon domain [Siphoviridae sp. ctYh54]